MEYVQEQVATLHDLTGQPPDAPVDRAAVVVPMTAREHAEPAPERTLETLEAVEPARVIVPLRAPASRVGAFESWLSGFDLDCTLLWCNAPAVEGLLAEHGIDGPAGKGRDVWLGMGLAAREEFVALHDADVKNYDASQVPRLLAPLDAFEFSKGYYARVENGRLYGRLFRLFYEPLVATLGERHSHELLEYLGAFRYALAGEMGFTSGVAREVRPEPVWGLETGLLGEAFSVAGFAGTAQVDLGVHEHDHRTVSGATGLATMSEHVADALFRLLEERGVEPDFDTLPERYRTTAERFVAGYAADAAFNGLEYDPAAERSQVDSYAEAIRPAGSDRRLPAWADTDLSPGDVTNASERALDAL